MRAAAMGRADDQSIETIKRRLAVYHGVQTPLEQYFTENKYKIYR
jgi:adenylate kinase family enzyme